MKRQTSSAVLLGSAGFLGLLTYALLAWDRTHHSMVSGPTQAEVRLALVLWSFTLASYFVVVPVTLALRRGSSVSVSWPLREALCLAQVS